jgi:replicative DNA helicase
MENTSISNTISSVASEAGIIATLMFHPEFSAYSEHLKPSHFTENDNSVLYQTITDLYKNNVNNIDVYNLHRYIQSDPKLKELFKLTISELDTVKKMAEQIARHSLPEYNLMVKTVSDMAYKRKTYNVLQKCQSLCYSKDFNRIKLQRSIYDEFSNINNEFSVREDLPLFSENIDELWVQTLVKQAANGYKGIPSKFDAVNEYYTFEESELVLIAAHAKAGKSMLCMNEMVHKLQIDRDGKDEISILYIDTEMNDRGWNERLLALLSQVPTKRIKSGHYSEQEKQRIEDAIAWIKTKKFSHIYLPNWSTDIIWEMAKKAQLNYGMNFFIFDYLKSKDGRNASEIYAELGNVCNFIKNDIVGAFNISGLCAAQLNRSGDIGDSYKLEQAASVVVNIARKSAKEITADGVKCGNYKLFVKRNRIGEQMNDILTDYVDLNFSGEVATFNQAENQHTQKDIPDSPYD